MPPSAIFATDDTMAIGALSAASDMGLVVPRDVSIVGFDDVAVAAYIRPALTTVRQSIEKIGEEAVKLLLDIVEQKSIPDPLPHLLRCWSQSWLFVVRVVPPPPSSEAWSCMKKLASFYALLVTGPTAPKNMGKEKRNENDQKVVTTRVPEFGRDQFRGCRDGRVQGSGDASAPAGGRSRD